jgi:hypothetical protein
MLQITLELPERDKPSEAPGVIGEERKRESYRSGKEKEWRSWGE